MKKHFGEYSYRLVPAVKKSGLSMEGLKLKHSEKDRARMDEDEFFHSLLPVAELRIWQGDGVHYFIETEELAAHIAGIVKNFDPRYLQILFDEGRTAGVIHTCGPQADGTLFSLHDEGGKTLIVSDKNEHQGLFMDTPDNGKVKPVPAMRLVFGLGLYLACFPGAVRDGFPDFAKHPAHYKGEPCAAVGTAPEIAAAGDRSGPSPHFRNGHYRILLSERFTKKRNQVVFVHETFVKGKVKTVMEVEAKPRKE